MNPQVTVKVFPALRAATAEDMLALWGKAVWDAQAFAREGGAPEAPVALRGRRLRLALAMRGGVSLAVWIGGAVAELDLIRALRVYRRCEGGNVGVVFAWDKPDHPPAAVLQRAEAYGRLLAEVNVHRVEIDVLAGASAGGLNSVLSAVAQRAGRSVASALQTWRDAGGLHPLIRPEGLWPVPSVMRGDDYFYEALLERLQEFSADPAGPHPGLQADYVSVDLSATVLNAPEAQNQAIREGNAGFKFATGIPGADIPAEDDGESLERLALAARTTSSFPGAFEPATIWSLSSGDRGAIPTSDDSKKAYAQGLDPKKIDSTDSFLVHRMEGQPEAFKVVDGGVFDNIPIERAFRAIRMRPASASVQRTLVYLDPAPPDPPEPATPFVGFSGGGVGGTGGAGQKDAGKARKKRMRGKNSLLPIVMRTALAKRAENAREDREEMEIALRERLVRKGRYDALAMFSLDGWDPAASEAGYVRSRASLDTALLESTLADPETWQLEEGITPRRAWYSPDEPNRDALVVPWLDRMRLFDRVNGMTQYPFDGAKIIANGPVTARDTALWLLECVQWLEQVLRQVPGAPQLDEGEIARIRERLYEVVEVQDAEINLRIGRLADALWAGKDPVAARDEHWWPESDATPALVWAELAEVYEVMLPLLGECRVTAEGTTGMALGKESLGGAQSAFGFERWWNEAPWKFLEQMARRDAEFSEIVRWIVPLYSVIGSPSTSESPMFFSITGRWSWWNLPHGSPLITALEDARETHEDQVLADVLRSADGLPGAAAMLEMKSLPARSRLAGTQLMNFGGFASVQWRETDWWWGRVDAAAAFTDFVRQSRPAVMSLPTPEELAIAVVEEARDTADPARLLTTRRGGMRQLRGSYKVSLLHRALRGVTRAMYGSPGAGKVLVGGLPHLFAPVGVFVPAIGQISRLVTALSLFALTFVGVYLAHQPVGARPTATVVMPLLAAAWLAVAIWGVLRLRKRWRRIRDLPGALPTAERRKTLWRHAWVAIGLTLLASAAVLFVAWIASASDWPLAVVYGLGALIVVLIAVLGVGNRIPKHGVPRDLGFRAVSILAVLALIFAPLMPRFGIYPAQPQAIMAAGLTATGAVLGWGVIGLPRPRPRPGVGFLPWRGPGHIWLGEIAAAIMPILVSGLGASVFLLMAGKPWWMWVVGVLLWGNVLWVIPMFLRLEAPSWSDDVLSRRVQHTR